MKIAILVARKLPGEIPSSSVYLFLSWINSITIVSRSEQGLNSRFRPD
jgi:hypothetical protein